MMFEIVEIHLKMSPVVLQHMFDQFLAANNKNANEAARL